MNLNGLLQLIVRDVAGKLGASLGEPSGSTKDAHACAIADIVALAALADGQVSREELKALERTTVGQDEEAVVASERLYRIDASAEDVRSPAWLAVKVGDLALTLDRDERRETLRLVAHLAEHLLLDAHVDAREAERHEARGRRHARGLGVPVEARVLPAHEDRLDGLLLERPVGVDVARARV